MRAQDRALLTLARQRGLLDLEREGRALAAVQAGGGAAALVREQVLAADAVSELLRELAASRFVCPACGAAADYAALAGLDDLACPSCRRALAITSARTTGAYRAQASDVAGRPTSGAYPTVRPSGGYPVVRPTSGAYPTIQPSGAHPAVRPTGSFPAAGAQQGGRPSGAYPASRASGQHALVSRARPSDRAPAGGGGPRRLGGYTLVRELGRGCNGVVWLAEREGLARRFAVKILSPVAAADATAVERFRREAQVASRLDHPGVVPVLDLGVEGEVPFLVMPYCPGQTLQDRLRAGALPPAEAARLVATLARAVAHAHGKHVLHRDLKPANVILDELEAGCPPRITDFGLARDLDLRSSLTQASDLVGTPYYMAPERFRGAGGDDPRVDVYALGVILYECLTGRRPFEAATPAELVRKLEGARPLAPNVANPSVPAGLGAVCLRAMARDPSDRHPSAEALASELDAFAADERPAPGPSSPGDGGPEVAVDSRRMELLALVLVVGGLLACAAVAWWAFVGDPETSVGTPDAAPHAPAEDDRASIDASPEAGAGPAVDTSPVVEASPAVETGLAVEASPAVETNPARELPSRPLDVAREVREVRADPPASAERADERRAMVDRLRAVYRGMPEAVLDVMQRVPRHVFVHPQAAARAYDDGPLPHFEGQTVSAPGIVAVMTALLDLAPGEKVLEVGTGSGYQAAVLAHLTPRVYSIELLEPLVRRARETLAAQGYREVAVRQGDGFHGWPEEAPFDAVLLTCSAPRVPEPLWEQLAPGGRVVMPEGAPDGDQAIVVIAKGPDGQPRRRVVMGVRFSPMVGEVQRR